MRRAGLSVPFKAARRSPVQWQSRKPGARPRNNNRTDKSLRVVGSVPRKVFGLKFAVQRRMLTQHRLVPSRNPKQTLLPGQELDAFAPWATGQWIVPGQLLMGIDHGRLSSSRRLRRVLTRGQPPGVLPVYLRFAPHPYSFSTAMNRWITTEVVHGYLRSLLSQPSKPLLRRHHARLLGQHLIPSKRSEHRPPSPHTRRAAPTVSRISISAPYRTVDRTASLAVNPQTTKPSTPHTAGQGPRRSRLTQTRDDR